MLQTDDISTVAPGVQRTECGWGYYLEGSKEALISAGLAQDSWFQDGTVRAHGRTVRSKKLTVNARLIKTTMVNQKRQMFCVRVEFTEAEQSARESAEVTAEMRRKLEGMAKNAETYRERMVDIFERFVSAAIILTPSDGYQLHADTISELQRLAGQMVNAIEVSKVVFSRKARTAAENKIRAQAAKADPALQSFMQRITGV